MKKLKKHAMILCLVLLLGIMAIVISFNASAFGRLFLPSSSSKVTVSSIPASSSPGTKSQSYTQADLFPSRIGKSETSVINPKSKTNTPASSDSGTDVSQSETDTTGWNQRGNAVGDSGITVAPISESTPVVSPSKSTSKPVPKPSQTKSKPTKQPVTPTKPQPVTPTKPQPVTPPTPQPVTPMQPTGGGSSNGGSSRRVVNITAVNLSKTDLSLKKGEAAALTASVSPENTTQSKTITWLSSNDKIATVDSTGKVTAVEGGSAKITAKASNGVTGVCNVTVTVVATKITLNLTDIDLEKGDSRIFTSTVNPTDSTDAVSWATSNNDIVSVDNTGKITAVAPGTATVTATAGTVTASCKVTVGISISQLKLSETSLTIKKGDSHSLTATINPPDTTEDKAVTWTTSDDKVATVDKDGNVEAVEGGSAVITAQVGTHTAQCTVDVIVPVTGISFESSDVSIEKGTSQILTPIFMPSDATDKTVSWTSSNETAATVDSSGKVSALTPGVTTITATSRDGGFTAHCTVHVVISIKGIGLSDKSLTLNKGSSKVLTITIDPPDTTEDKTIHWTSSNPAVASVDSSGNVSAVEGGTATITAAVGKHTVTCDVTVVVPVTGISLDQTSLKIAKGTGATLTATLQPADATDKGISWASSNPDIVTVDTSGKLQAVAVGQSTITATSHDGGFIANCTVSVVIPVTGISLDQTSLILQKGGMSKLTAIVSPANATDKAVSWATSNPGVAAVDGCGNITAVGGGTVVITATSHDGGFTAQCTVNVPIPVTGISLNKTVDTIKAGSTDALVATVIPSDAVDKTVIWSSNNPSAVTVDQNGVVSAVAFGKATITATTRDGGFTASCNISVPVTWTCSGYAAEETRYLQDCIYTGNSATHSVFIDEEGGIDIGVTDGIGLLVDRSNTYTFDHPFVMHAGQTLSLNALAFDATQHVCIEKTILRINGTDVEKGDFTSYTFQSDTQVSSIQIELNLSLQSGKGLMYSDVTVNSSYGSFLLNNTGTSAQ